MPNPADMVPFAKTMGITITAMDRDRVCGEMLVRPEICTAGNGRGSPSIHGGAVMTFASIVYGEATPFKVGRRQSVWQTKIRLEDGTLVAVVTQTQIVL